MRHRDRHPVMTPAVTGDDVGKTVMDANGDRIGDVAAVKDGTAFVDPDDGVDTTVVQALGWAGPPEGPHPLRTQSIDDVTGSAIHLRSNL